MRKFFGILGSLCRVIFYGIVNLGKLKLRGLAYHVGRGANLVAQKKGRIYLGKHTWIERYSTVCAAGGKIRFGANNYFNSNVKIVSMGNITIGDNNLFGPNVVIVDHNHKYDEKDVPICKQGFVVNDINLGSDIWVGANTTICAGVTICDRVVIGANSVVTKDITQSGVYAGVPAKFIKEL